MTESPCLDPTRAARISRAVRETFDVAIIGGGIVGACAARDAAFRGYSVLLLEAVDYAFATSSRSSKFLHGGIRYLEQGDLGLVHEALIERDIVLRAAPHICRSQRAFFPVIPGLTRPAWQIRIGFALYDLLAKDFFRPLASSAFPGHERVSGDSVPAQRLRDIGLNYSALFAYSDGQMDDTRLVIENIVDAERLGAVPLNHARVTMMQKSADGWKIRWKDELSGSEQESRAKFVVNAAGPWAAELASGTSGESPLPEVRFSRGTHLLFDVEWDLPGLTLPTGAPGRVYFAWPYFSGGKRGVIVGPTDRSSPNEPDPQPNQSEIDELLGYLKRDLPGAGLTEKTLYRSFCGMRSLVPHCGKKGPTSAISRREKFIQTERSVTILGGKYTTARRTAEHAVDLLEKLQGRVPDKKKHASLRSRLLPGAENWTPETDPRPRVAAALKRILTHPAIPEGSNDFSYLTAATRAARSIEHAATWEDIILRRLVAWAQPVDLSRLEAELKRRLADFE